MGVGVRSQESVAGRFRLCCPCFLYQAMYYKGFTIIQQALIIDSRQSIGHRKITAIILRIF
ncbi:MAG: hypothetical protein EWV91_09440 [Microcystis aeruginosa Ma_QC_Ca_00000000_S207]|uniref:Uncharacterized protein n=1 Tax=Microcystis aeruginosa Ma_QC_Ca_00000000_S207 TaxID=2486251 RepID=A0A552FNM3_MICAE|nr:MAG: hypothetical protein EWV91_09440 [Microcystis aeruginosa Ma_QC_Ca_00000000_S207]